MSGCNFGDEGLFFLAESLAYNQVAEEVNFAANGITAEGIFKAFDGILQSNISLKVLNLSRNNIRDEGAKGAKAIAELLKKNSTLRTIELNNNLIDYSGFSGLAEALLENKSLNSLYLKGPQPDEATSGPFCPPE
ncbi:unnamed protein product [Lactuca saligna]|uniref:Uncharacterized protein n=1 Tax=Lactuca saligna TaxID=75948 RepID=A0AA35VB83_LACSI|nr:unnamed protein product [Lactuca saligna]